MTLFSLLESLFFMSLALSFFLIFLMVYHFKKRMDALDRKNETLGDICKTLIKEIEFVKEMKLEPPPFLPQELNNPLDDFFRQMNESRQTTPPDPLDLRIYSDEVIRDVEVLSDDEDSETDENDEDLDTDEGEDEVDLDTDEGESLDDEESERAEDKTEGVSERAEDIPERAEDKTEGVQDKTEGVQDKTEGVQDKTEGVQDKTEGVQEVLPSEFEETEEPLEESVLTEPERQLSRRALKNMSVQMLRMLCIRDGLCTDPSKMKKKELIELLNDGMPAL